MTHIVTRTSQLVELHSLLRLVVLELPLMIGKNFTPEFILGGGRLRGKPGLCIEVISL